jgi:PAS domain S-box-containing protein
MSTAAAVGSPGASAREEIPFTVLHAAVGAVAAGEVEDAFATLIDELRPWGVRAAALLAYDGSEIRRVAGVPVGSSSRRIALYDGPDAVGEIQLELEGTLPVELLELLQDVFGLGLGRQMRTEELDVVRAAVAVNAAQTLDDALDAIAEACARVARAPYASVTVWEPDISAGVVRGAAGDALAFLGERLECGSNLAYRAVSSGQPVHGSTGPMVTGLSALMQKRIGTYPSALAVPLIADGAPPLAIQIGWREQPRDGRIEATIAAVRKLGALTTVAFRAAEERAQAERHERLRRVIDTVPDGLWIQSSDGAFLNAAARRLFPADAFERWEAFRPRLLDGTPAEPKDFPAVICMETRRESQARLILEVDGEDRVIDLKAAPCGDGWVGLIRDVTEEHGEHALTKEFLNHLFEAMPIAAATADPVTRKVLDVNPAFERLVGFSRDEIIGSTPPHPWWSSSLRAEDDGAPWLEQEMREAVFRRKDARPGREARVPGRRRARRRGRPRRSALPRPH